MLDITSIPLFGGLRKEEIRTILAAATNRKFEKSETLILAESPATRLMVVKTGFVNFYVTTEKGQKLMLRRFVPGNVLGIAAFLDEPMGYLGTATAIGDVEALVWEHSKVIQLARAYPAFFQNAFRIALQYIAIYARRHISLVTNTAQERLAYALTSIGSREGRTLMTGVEVDIRNEDLAALADVGYFTASRLLKKWERAGAVMKSRGKILIRIPEKLLADEDRPKKSLAIPVPPKYPVPRSKSHGNGRGVVK
jgi:CRP/FNR family transcriptional regulator, nitrogen oxide reductase regulator